MWPWGHLVVGYLLYTAYTHVRWRDAPNGPATILLALGTQFPDLVDKPLAWTFHVLPSGRSFAHSLFAAAAATLLVRRWAERSGRPSLGVAFGLGYASHLAADAIAPVLNGDYAKLTYFGWPLLPAPDYGVELGFAYHFTHMAFTPFFAFQLLLAALVAAIWVRDGAPGIGMLRVATRRVFDRVTAR